MSARRDRATTRPSSTAVRRIADDVAAPNARSVDRDARFPSETLDALRAEGALSAFVPAAYGGDGLALRDRRRRGVRARPSLRGQRHGLRDAPDPGRDASCVTSTGRRGSRATCASLVARPAADRVGDVGDRDRRRHRPVDRGGDARRTTAASPSRSGPDRVVRRPGRRPAHDPAPQPRCRARRPGPRPDQRDQTTLEQTGTWDPLGMRGTCSPGFAVRARFPTEQVLPVPFSTIAPKSMVPVTHVLWSHVWLGIATDAFDRARAFVRASAKGRPEAAPPTGPAAVPPHDRARPAARRSRLAGCATSSTRRPTTSGSASSRWRMILRFNNLKLAASEQAPRICQGALGVTAASSATRTTRRSASGATSATRCRPRLMVANERIHQTNASLLLIAQGRLSMGRSGCHARPGGAASTSSSRPACSSRPVCPASTAATASSRTSAAVRRARHADRGRRARRADALPAGPAAHQLERAATSSPSRTSPARSSASRAARARRRAVRAGEPPRGLERAPGMTERRPRPGRRATRCTRGRRARAGARRRPDRRSGRVVRVPPRAVGRPGAAADVPHARAGPDRRARRRSPPGATAGSSAASSCCACLGLDAAPMLASDPFFGRSGRMLAASQREQALKVEILVPDRRPDSRRRSRRSTTTRTTSRRSTGSAATTAARSHTACLGFGHERIVLALLRTPRPRPGRLAGGRPSRAVA